MKRVCEMCLASSNRQEGETLGHPGERCDVCGTPILPGPALGMRHDDTIHVSPTAPILPPPLPNDGEPWGAPRLRHDSPPKISLRGGAADLRRIAPPKATPRATQARVPRAERREDDSLRPLAGERSVPAARASRPRSWLGSGIALGAVLVVLGLASSRGNAPDSTGSDRRPADWSGSAAAQVPADPQRFDVEENPEGRADVTPASTEENVTRDMLEQNAGFTEVPPSSVPPVASAEGSLAERWAGAAPRSFVTVPIAGPR